MFAAAALTITACSGVGNDAARVGDTALSSSDLTTWLDDIAGAQPATFLAPSGATSAEGARELLTRWISAQVLARVVEDEGGEITDEDRTAARAQVEASGSYTGASDESLDRLAEFEAALIALDRTIDLTRSEAADLYAQGAETSGVVCARAIIGQTEADVEDALARVAAGEDFATVADSVNPEGNIGPGGAILDETGSECIALGQFTAGVQPAVNDAVLSVGIDEPTEIIDLDGAFVSLLLRPFKEVSQRATEVMAGSAARSVGREALQSSSDDVEVASRFGRWDAEQMAVVAIG